MIDILTYFALPFAIVVGVVVSVAIVHLTVISKDLLSELKDVQAPKVNLDRVRNRLFDCSKELRKIRLNTIELVRMVDDIPYPDRPESLEDLTGDDSTDETTYDRDAYFEESELPDDSVALPEPYDRYVIDLHGRIFSCASRQHDGYKRIVSQQVAIYPRPDQKEDGKYQTIQMRRERLFYELLVGEVPEGQMVKEPETSYSGHYVSNLSLRNTDKRRGNSKYFQPYVPEWMRVETQRKVTEQLANFVVRAGDPLDTGESQEVEPDDLPDNLITLPYPYHRYRVNPQGRFFSCASPQIDGWKELSVSSNYLSLAPDSNEDDDREYRTIQMRRERLMYEMFVDQVPEGCLVSKTEDDFEDSYLETLTLKEDTRDRFKNGSWQRYIPDFVRYHLKEVSEGSFRKDVSDPENFMGDK